MLPVHARRRAGDADGFVRYDMPALVLVLALSGITLVSLLRPQVLLLNHSDTLLVALTSAILIIALGATFFALGEFLLDGLIASLFVGMAFLVFAGAGALKLVPVLAGWHRQQIQLSPGWAIENLVGAVLLAVAAVLVERGMPARHRVRNSIIAVSLACLLTLSISFWTYLPAGTIESTIWSRTLQLAAGLLFFGSAVRFWWTSKLSHRPWYVWLALNLTIAGYAQIDFAIRQYPLGYVQFGDALRLVFFTGILLALAGEWNRGYRRLRLQTRELEALHALMKAPMVQDVASVVQHVIRVVGETLEANARLLVTGRNGRTLRDPLVMQMTYVDAGDPVSSDGDDARTIVVGVDEGPRGQVALGVPLGTNDRRLGMLVVVRESGHDFTATDARLLRAFGAQASVLLERSLLYEEVAAGAVMQERSRLAREIHDGLAQHLASLKMRVSWLQRSPAALDVGQLRDIEGVLETALTEARQAITTLRSDPEGTSAAEAIASYAEEFGQVSGMRVGVERSGNEPDVGPKARVELLRVVQEALNNVRKHANATRVNVRIAKQDGGTCINIADNGSGFVVDQTMQGHFGLEIMRERMESIGGRLVLTSSPGAGTSVAIWVPAPRPESENGQQDWLGMVEG
jgi:signal transduction histidine kinase